MVSLFIFLLLCFEGIKFTFVVILFTIRNLTSWSERPFTIGELKEGLNLVLPVKILSKAVLKEF
jgi:hypothetical protein